MSSAVKVIYGMRADEVEQEKARIRQKSLYDMYSSISLAEKRGREEGEIIGLKKGRAEGIVNSESSFARLIGLMTAKGRLSEIAEIGDNKEKLQDLYREFGVS